MKWYRMIKTSDNDGIFDTQVPQKVMVVEEPVEGKIFTASIEVKELKRFTTSPVESVKPLLDFSGFEMKTKNSTYQFMEAK